MVLIFIKIKDFHDLCRIYYIQCLRGEIMGRRKRIEYYGAMYHIIHRGNNEDFIFRDNEEKIELLKIVGDVKEEFDFKLYAYVIMDNHYHFVIRTFNIPISEIMHRINTRYAKYYNWRKDRTGSPFEGRYRALPIQNHCYLLRLVKYIHDNPVEAKIIKDMSEYQWSSDIFYRMNIGNIVDIDELLGGLSEDRDEAIKRYVDFMDLKDTDDKDLKKEFEEEDIIGDNEFKESFIDKESDINEKEIFLDEILKLVCPSLVDYELIKQGSRKRYLMSLKQKYANKALSYGYNLVEISDNINISHSALRKILNGTY